MNCESIQRDILLDGSGELPARRKSALERHLSACSNCRDYKRQAASLVNLAAHTLPDAGPSSRTMELIVAEGIRAADRRPAYIFNFPARRVLSVAAGLLLVAASSCLLFVANWRATSAAHGRRVSQMHTIMAMVAEDEYAASETAASGANRPDMRALSMRILKIEGLGGDEQADGEEIILDDDDQPRDLQSHSTSDSRPAECV